MKVLAVEARDLENQAIRDLMKKYEHDDQLSFGRKRTEIERSRAEVICTNEECFRRKVESKEMAKKEVEDILMYQALKDAELKNMVATYFDYFCLCQFVSIQNSH
jgi:hypothetical protein